MTVCPYILPLFDDDNLCETKEKQHAIFTHTPPFFCNLRLAAKQTVNCCEYLGLALVHALLPL